MHDLMRGAALFAILTMIVFHLMTCEREPEVVQIHEDMSGETYSFPAPEMVPLEDR